MVARLGLRYSVKEYSDRHWSICFTDWISAQIWCAKDLQWDQSKELWWFKDSRYIRKETTELKLWVFIRETVVSNDEFYFIRETMVLTPPIRGWGRKTSPTSGDGFVTSSLFESLASTEASDLSMSHGRRRKGEGSSVTRCLSPCTKPSCSIFLKNARDAKNDYCCDPDCTCMTTVVVTRTQGVKW